LAIRKVIGRRQMRTLESFGIFVLHVFIADRKANLRSYLLDMHTGEDSLMAAYTAGSIELDAELTVTQLSRKSNANTVGFPTRCSFKMNS